MSTQSMIRQTVSLTLGLSFIVMSVTGIMLFIVPKGRVAYWSDWEMFGLSKEQYGDIHTTSMVLFILVTVWHIYNNWTPLVNYLKNEAKKVTLFKKEFAIALVLNALFIGGTLAYVPPFSNLLDFKESIKNGWEKEYGSPPYGHAEESTLNLFAKRIGQDPQRALKLLKDKGIKVDSPNQTLKQIGRNNAMAPQVIYEAIRPQKESVEKEVSFLGRRTLGELAQMGRIDLDKSIVFLKAKGIEATPKSQMRELAEGLGVTPYALFDKLKAH